ncbi:MAG: hypothetical protein RJA63_998 [Pseudomonadota bacterium]|jgi:hypothetical protein
MASNQTSGFFDIDTPEKFFALLERRHKDLQGPTKDTADLMLLIMGLNHLREWIAPGYKPFNKDRTLKPRPPGTAEELSWKIAQLAEFNTLRLLCNHNKHTKNDLARKLQTQYDAPLMSQWGKLSDVSTLSDGPPTDYLIDDENVLDAIKTVLDFYRSEWFSRSKT